MLIEREARRAIRAEIEPFEPQGASVSFRADRNDRVRATIVWKGKPHLLYFKRVGTGRNDIKSIVTETRRAMRQLGIPLDKATRQQVGSLGEILREALAPPPPATRITRRSGATRSNRRRLRRHAAHTINERSRPPRKAGAKGDAQAS